MPELPEVEITRRGIEPLVQNKTIKRVVVHNSSLRWQVPDVLSEILVGQRIKSVGRRSKYLLFACDNGTMIVHLGMTGHLRCVSSDNVPRRKHDHVEFVFTDGTVMLYNDSRRFGAILWTDACPANHPLLVKLGPEPFSENCNADLLYRLSRGRKVAIKQFLMNAHIIVGVGNIYANEALFYAGVSPKRHAGQVSRARFEVVVESVVRVLEDAIKSGGTTIRDFADSNGNPGYFKQKLSVYGREGLQCVQCDSMIQRIRLGQRATYYCPKCQR